MGLVENNQFPTLAATTFPASTAGIALRLSARGVWRSPAPSAAGNPWAGGVAQGLPGRATGLSSADQAAQQACPATVISL